MRGIYDMTKGTVLATNRQAITRCPALSYYRGIKKKKEQGEKTPEWDKLKKNKKQKI
jgi:hypothetical protein